MPVYLARTPSTDEHLNNPRIICAGSLPSAELTPDCIDIGIINNMPDGALQSTERQFLALLDSVSDGFNVRLTFYALPDVPRSEWGLHHVRKFYSDVEELWPRYLDGLIVTGTEPRAARLQDEPYWTSFTRVLDWAEHHTHSAVWSCLAAHAAVLHLDGISRRHLNEKLFGLYEYVVASDHPLISGLPPRVIMPHSRWNDLPEVELLNRGYSVLTRSAVGVDAFFKQDTSLFLFLQGHPEYDPDTLLLEYRRDIGRYLRSETDAYPGIPHAYFNQHAQDRLADLRERAVRERREQLLADFPTGLLEPSLANTWRAAAARLYRNWLNYLYATKRRASDQTHAGKQSVREPDAALTRGAAAGAD